MSVTITPASPSNLPISASEIVLPSVVKEVTKVGVVKLGEVPNTANPVPVSSSKAAANPAESSN